MAQVELLIGPLDSNTGKAVLLAMKAAIRAAGDDLVNGEDYRGGREWLVLFGVGSKAHDAARRRQIKAGGRCLLFDMGYFNREKVGGHVRASIDADHPQRWLDRTQPARSRWDGQGIPLREDADADGPIVLVGLGRKSRQYLGVPRWEQMKLAELHKRFPGRRVIFRPKPNQTPVDVNCESDIKTPIEKLLRGASLVVCRHSNVAVDAAIAGVPIEVEDGAAAWLEGKPYTPDNRLDFLRRLAWWQWRPTEAADAWQFFKGIVCV